MTNPRLLVFWLTLLLGACTAGDPATFAEEAFGAPGDARPGLAASADRPAFKAELTPIPEIVGPRSRGEARFWLSDDGDSLHYEVSVKNLGRATSAHLHVVPSAHTSQGVPHYRNPPALEGAHGPVTAFLLEFVSGGIPGDGVIAQGSIGPSDLIGKLKGQPISVLIGLLENKQAYVTVHVLQETASGQAFCCPDGLRGTVGAMATTM